ncbi:MAG: PH domain-containing protein [Patescibacteria group bacterium]|nr:PH domain-containing protein [Patescibacteria group bacterium]
MPVVYNAKKDDVDLKSQKKPFGVQEEATTDKLIKKDNISGENGKTHKDLDLKTTKSKDNVTSRAGLFSTYCINPRNVNFYHKDSHEKIILLLRRHLITNVPWAVIAFCMLIAPFFFSLLNFTEMIPWEFKTVFVIVWYMITIAFVLEEFLGWLYHVNIITDERIMEIDFVNLIYREITDANIDQIQDVTVEMGGIWRTIFKFGDVVIQTAGEVPKIRFEAVPDPDSVAKILRDLRVEEEQEKLEGRVR